MFGVLILVVAVAVVLYFVWTFVVGTRADTSPDATQTTSGNAFTQGTEQVKNFIPAISQIFYQTPKQPQGETIIPINVAEGETAFIPLMHPIGIPLAEWQRLPREERIALYPSEEAYLEAQAIRFQPIPLVNKNVWWIIAHNSCNSNYGSISFLCSRSNKTMGRAVKWVR